MALLPSIKADKPSNESDVLKIYSKLSSKLPFLSYAPLFNIQFMSWDEAKRGEVFSVNFSPIDGNCFPTKYEEESYDGLFNLRENMSGPS